MIIDCKKYAGACACGQAHEVTTQLAIIEAGCMQRFDEHLAQAGFIGRRTAIYDTNTYNAKGLIRPRANAEIVLEADGLVADDHTAARLLEQLDGATELLVAIGTGTLHDLVRHCAYQRGIPFIACPTAASSDGFMAGQSVMGWRGGHAILPGVAPVLVLADLDVIRNAPDHLAMAGVGDALSKFTSLADWKIAALLQGKQVCPVAESILRQAAIAAQGCCALLSRGDKGSFAQLMYALLLSGLAMQMLDSVQPAAGAEHLLATLMNLPADAGGCSKKVPQNEQIGVCTAVVADAYHHLAEADDIAPLMKAYKPLEKEWFTKSFGDVLGTRLMHENAPDCLLAVEPDSFARHWPAIRHIIADIPRMDDLLAMLSAAGASATPDSLGLTRSRLSGMLQRATYLRNQLTLARILHTIKPHGASKASASRPSSRKRRYADSAIMRAGKSKAASASTIR